MSIAGFTGSRIGAIVSLRVKDCDNGVFRFKPQKREKRERYVPIHSTLVPIIKELVRGKKPDDDLLGGFPVPPSGSQRERSMPAVKRLLTIAVLWVWMSGFLAGNVASLISTPSA